MSERPLQILLVDDEESDFYLIKHALFQIASQQFELDWASTYEEALEKIAQQAHDAYLIDYRLGANTGLDLLQAVQAEGSSVPFIMLTGQGSTEVDLAAMQAGATDYLDKNDIKPDLLERSLRYAIANKQAEMQLKMLFERVSGLEQLKSDMIRIASHDLRGPLTSAKNYLDLLRSVSNLPDDQLDYLNEVDRAITRMYQIVMDLLSLDRIESMIDAETQDDVDLCVVAREVYDDQASSATQKRIDLDLQQPEDDAVLIVRGDAVQLREALLNLVSNAIKYTPEGGRVVISLGAQDGRAVVRVEDNGYGIPPAQQDRLFRPFSRIKTKETLAIDGTGLGLHLVKNIIERYKGEIVFFSVYGEGSVFGFELPLAH